MKSSLVPYELVPQLAKTDVAYATGDPLLEEFYAFSPDSSGFQRIFEVKKRKIYPRAELAAALRRQYASVPDAAGALSQIDSLEHDNTFTVVTAHQPSLFLGPLYFVYKAVSTIVLARRLEKELPGDPKIIPVFVLGSEDHDLEELNSIHVYGKKISWNSAEKGAVGDMSTEGLSDVLAELSALLGESEAARALYSRIERAYAGQKTIAAATQAVLHDLLGKYGLIVLNMNDVSLKRRFLPVIKEELTRQTAFEKVTETIGRLNEKGFKTQASPREINLFYLMPGLRERIVLENGIYRVLNTSLEFGREEILQEAENHPERFSPNVVLRPLYQEMILPNLAYVGGGGELAYWLERKSLFDHFDVVFPVLIRRNSLLWIDKDSVKKLEKFGFTPVDFFGETDALIRRFIERNAAAEVNLNAEMKQMREIFEQIASKALQIDPTLEKAVRADEVKNLGALEQWQGRLLRAEKQKHEVSVNQIRNLKEKLFPGGGLQERHDNIFPWLLKYGDSFIEILTERLNPLEKGFCVIEDNV